MKYMKQQYNIHSIFALLLAAVAALIVVPGLVCCDDACTLVPSILTDMKNFSIALWLFFFIVLSLCVIGETSLRKAILKIFILSALLTAILFIVQVIFPYFFMLIIVLSGLIGLDLPMVLNCHGSYQGPF